MYTVCARLYPEINFTNLPSCIKYVSCLWELPGSLIIWLQDNKWSNDIRSFSYKEKENPDDQLQGKQGETTAYSIDNGYALKGNTYCYVYYIINIDWIDILYSM